MKTLSEMVREAGLPEAWISKNGVLSWAQLKRFSKLVRADEREACAKVCEALPLFGGSESRQWERATLKDCAEAIRARGEIK